MRYVNRVLVVGAGIGGLGASAALAQRGFEIDLIEIDPAGVVPGVGINQPANSLRALQAVGALDECLAVGYPFTDTAWYDWHEDLIVNIRSGLGGEDVPANLGLSRPDLRRALVTAAEKTGVAIRYGTTVSLLASTPDRVEVRFSDGQSQAYDLVLGFDGIRSQLRRELLGDAYQPVYSGYGVWRVTCDRPGDVTGVRVFHGVGTYAGVIPLSQDKMYMFQVTSEPGNPRHDPERLHELLRVRLAGFAGLIGEVRDGLTEHSGVVYGPLSEVMLPSPWYSGRALILGDAAHACMPTLTQGAAMALEDGVVLAELLANDEPLPQTLEAFMGRRYPRARFVHDVSRQIVDAGMGVTADSMPGFKHHLAAELPNAIAAADAFLRQPA